MPTNRVATLVNAATQVQPFVPSAAAEAIDLPNVVAQLRYALSIGEPMPMHVRQEVVNALIIYEGTVPS